MLPNYRNNSNNPAVTPNIPIIFFTVNSSLKVNEDAEVSYEVVAALLVLTFSTLEKSVWVGGWTKYVPNSRKFDTA